MNVTAEWRQGLSFTGTAGSGFTVPLVSGPEAGGPNDGFEPLELLALSLAGCTAMDVISILEKKKQAVSAFEVKVHTRQAHEYPHVFTRAVITYKVTGHNLQEHALLRSIELSASKYCPVQAMLGRVIPIELIYEIYEHDESGKPRLVKQGEYRPPPDQATAMV